MTEPKQWLEDFDVEADKQDHEASRAAREEEKRRGAIAITADRYLSDILQSGAQYASSEALVDHAWRLAELMHERRNQKP